MMCPRCGFQNVQDGRFCASCGNSLPLYPNSPIGQPYYSSPARSGMSGSTKAIIIAVVIVGLFLILPAATFFYYTSSLPSSRVSFTGPVTITSIELAVIYQNQPGPNYFGPQYQFVQSGPIYLQYSQSYTTRLTLTLAANQTSHTVTSLGLGYSEGITVQSTSPVTPFTVTPGTTTIVAVTLRASSTTFNGPVTIDVFTY